MAYYSYPYQQDINRPPMQQPQQQQLPINGNSYYQQMMMQQQQAAMQQQQMSPGFLKGRPVVSIEEARAAQIDLDGSMSIFTDVGNKKIYTKQINLDGTASLNIYELTEDKKSMNEEYITYQDFNNIITNMRLEIESLKEEHAKLLNEKGKAITQNDTKIVNGNGNAKQSAF